MTPRGPHPSLEEEHVPQIQPEADLQELGERFGFDPGGLTHPPRYNAAPTQPALAVMNGDGRHAECLSWGLVPSWAKDARVGSRMINARAETLAERPASPAGAALQAPVSADPRPHPSTSIRASLASSRVR